MLLISWPNTAVTTKSPASSAYGPRPPTTPMSASAIRSAAPVWVIAVESGIIPATSTTVVHEMPRYAASDVSTRVTTSALAATSPATAEGTIPVASATIIRPRIASARPAPGPSGTACRRTSSGWSTRSTPRVARVLLDRRPRAVEQDGITGRERGLAGAEVLAVALHREHDELAGRRDHAREHRLADERRPGRDEDLGDARVAPQERGGDIDVGRQLAVEAVLGDERLGVARQVGGHRLRQPLGDHPRPDGERHRDRSDQERDADQGELEEPEAGPGELRGVVGHDDVHGRAGQGQHRPGVRPEHERQQQLRRRASGSNGDHHHHRQQRRHGPVDADHGRQRCDEQHRQEHEPGPRRAATLHQQRPPTP